MSMVCGVLAACMLATSPGGMGGDTTALSNGVAAQAATQTLPARGSVEAMVAPLVAAHRGGFFGHQGDLGRIGRTLSHGNADIIETDLRSTRDGVIVVSHDPLLESRTTCAGAIADATYPEIASCRLRSSRRPLPLFSQLLEIARGHAIVDAEFKTDASIIPAIDIVMAAGAMDGVYFQIGDNQSRYQQVRACSKDANLQFKATSDDALQWALSLHDPHLRIIEMDRDFITPARIAQAHAQGKLVSENTWRYQYTEERFASSCTRAFTGGVDIAVTNNPGSCFDQRHSRPYSAAHRWVYSVVGRPHVRGLARRIVAEAQARVLSLQAFVPKL